MCNRYHVDPKSGLKRGKTDMYVHVVDMESNTIMQPEKILKVVDANYDYLSIYYEEAGIMSILLAEEVRKESTGFWDPNLAALLALILVLFLGIIMFSIVCCCVKPWIFNAHANRPKKLREAPGSPGKRQEAPRGPMGSPRRPWEAPGGDRRPWGAPGRPGKPRIGTKTRIFNRPLSQCALKN